MIFPCVQPLLFHLKYFASLPYQWLAAHKTPLHYDDGEYQAASLREQMWARAQPEILGPTVLLLQKQIQRSVLGTRALTGQRGVREGGSRTRGWRGKTRVKEKAK